MREGIRVLFVCLGNICRSPMAEGVFRAMVSGAGLADRIEVASAGTGSWYLGEPPHPGTVAVLARRGISLPGKRAVRVDAEMLRGADYVAALDRDIVRQVRETLGGGTSAPDVALLLDHAPQTGLADVPDPYYDGRFEETYDLIEAGCRGLLEDIRQREGL